MYITVTIFFPFMDIFLIWICERSLTEAGREIRMEKNDLKGSQCSHNEACQKMKPFCMYFLTRSVLYLILLYTPLSSLPLPLSPAPHYPDSLNSPHQPVTSSISSHPHPVTPTPPPPPPTSLCCLTFMLPFLAVAQSKSLTHSSSCFGFQIGSQTWVSQTERRWETLDSCHSGWQWGRDSTESSCHASKRHPLNAVLQGYWPFEKPSTDVCRSRRLTESKKWDPIDSGLSLLCLIQRISDPPASLSSLRESLQWANSKH